MTEYKCQYCGKIYTNSYILATHQNTAKFCLEIQNRQAPDTNVHTCTFCNESFTVKQTLVKHLLSCKEKKKAEEEKKKEEDEKQIALLTEELTRLKAEVSGYQELKTSYALSQQMIQQLTSEVNKLNICATETQKLKTEHAIALQKINSLYDQLEEKDRYLNKQLEEKDRQIQQLNTTIKEKDTYIQEHPQVTNIYNTNQTTAQYNLSIQTEFEKLTPFTEENVKMNVTNIQPMALIEFNDYNIMLNFCSIFGRILSQMAIVTDKSRGLLLIKTKDGEKQKYQSKALILDALSMSEHECKDLFNRTARRLERLELDNDIMPNDQALAHNDLTLLRHYITNKTMDKTVQRISNVVMNNSAYISKRLPNHLESIDD